VSAYVSGDWLQQRLGDTNVRVLEASTVKETTYDTAHIPGAAWVEFHADLLRNGDESSGAIITPEQFGALMSRLGVTPQTTVVWYGDRHSSYAIRGFWMLDYYQHPGGCYVLEGGRERWIAEQRPTTLDVPVAAPASYPVPARSDPANEASWQEVLAAINAPERVVLDVRSQEEYDGQSVRAKRGGHIPGAVHIEWTDATAGDNLLKPAAQLRAMYGAHGVTPDKQIIAHCQLGIRAVHTWFVLKHVLGYPNVKNYDGSWQEWGNRDDLPIEP
jgi:thiosulfate/3-mercaptopyruvate sulfurtransferase